MIEEQQNIRTKIVIICINISVALLHFLTGPGYAGPFRAFVNGYLLDLLIPFAWYFLLILPEQKVKLLNPWYIKSALVFAVGAGVEIAQFFGVPLFGRTFDPLDFVMYGVGGILAAICDRLLFPKIFNFRPTEKN